MTFVASEISPRMGTRITIDKETLLSGTRATELRELWELRGVLVFPKIHLTDEEQLAFTRTTGRKSLVLGSGADSIEGMGKAAGRALLRELHEWSVQPRYVYRHEWRVGRYGDMG